MAVPDFQTFMLPLLKFANDGQNHPVSEAVEVIGNQLKLSEDDRGQLLRSGQTRLHNRIAWATSYLKKAGLVHAVGRGQFQITDRGREVLVNCPGQIDVGFLEAHFPEFAEFRRSRSQEAAEESPATFNSDGTWNLRPAVEERIKQKLELALRNDAIRRAGLDLFGSAIEMADEERSSAWCVRETSRGIRLMTGRLRAFEIGRSNIRMSVLGPISEDVRTRLGAESEEDVQLKHIPGGLILKFPIERAPDGALLLKEAMSSFIEAAMARVRRTVALEDHTPEAVFYIGKFVGRDLPQPVPASSSDEPELDDASDEEATSKEPRVRGRAPIFELGHRSIGSLIGEIENEAIALPDLQRPFVWEDTKVRELLDSLFVGFPVGTLVFWHTSNGKEARALGGDRPALRATTLVIDGQQRLTSLYAVMQGVDVIGKDGLPRKIEIAFRPRDGRFEVADAAIRRDPEFLPNVTELWKQEGRPKSQIRRDLLSGLRSKGRIVDDAYAEAVEQNLERASGITDYRFPTVDIRRTAGTQEANEEDVAEIFVRINNQGMRLGQADFVLTLLSVYHEELRDSIEERARAMSETSLITLDTQQLLRAICGVAFDRARMSAVYRYLRGVDPITGEADPDRRSKLLKDLDDAARECMQATPWRDYLLRVKHAGFVSPNLVASKNAIVNGYAFYIRGRKLGVSKNNLDSAVARWIFGSLLTARYSGSSETTFEEDLARLARLESGDVNGFVKALDQALGDTITRDYWTQTLVSSLETQKARAPAPLAFRAAQVVLGARALFSDQLLQNLLDPPATGGRTAGEIHHLFPKIWLHSHGFTDRRSVNQVATLADVGWHDNSLIGGQCPKEYVPRLREKLGITDDDRWGRMCAEHALPLRWEHMEYEQFLRERRQRMANVIHVAFRLLGGESDAAPITPPWFLPGAEEVWKRIAETERALRSLVRRVYAGNYADGAATKIEQALPERERETLAFRMRTRPPGSDSLNVVDYLYLGQLPNLLFAPEAWQFIRENLGGPPDLKQRLQSAVAQIAPVRNEIAHIREVDPNRLLRATAACAELNEILQRLS